MELRLTAAFNSTWTWLERPVKMLVVAGLVAVASAWGLMVIGALKSQMAIWPANGLLIAFMLMGRRRNWPWYLLIGAAVNILVHVGFHFNLQTSILFSLANTVEIALASVLISRKVQGNPDLSHPATLGWFALYAVGLAPAVAGLLALMAAALLGHISSTPLVWHFSLGHFYLADALGIALMTPLVLAIRQDELQRMVAKEKILEATALLTALLVVTTLVFSQNSYAIGFLIFPFLLLIMFRLNRSGSAVAVFLMSIPAIYFTVHLRGPFSLHRFSGPGADILQAQCYLFVLMVMVYGVAAALGEQQRLEMEFRRSEERYRILADHSWDVIILTDLEGHRKYVSPSVLDMLGWTPEELVGQHTGGMLHPDDKPLYQLHWQNLINDDIRLVSTIRTQMKTGDYLWVEVQARLVCDPGTQEPREVVCVVRDVSKRVAEQQKLVLAYQQAEVAATIDTLTGLANRRKFDDALQGEWNRAVRDKTVLSVLMLDADHFKAYNDRYGHLAGDTCLKAIADSIRGSVFRPGDVAARYGGEEFAVILPNTPVSGATEIAERIRFAVAHLDMKPDGLNVAHVTISIGIASAQPHLQPEKADDPSVLMEAADQCLYSAKRRGRNCVRAAEMKRQSAAELERERRTAAEAERRDASRFW